jgi:hypothetical protein
MFCFSASKGVAARGLRHTKPSSTKRTFMSSNSSKNMNGLEVQVTIPTEALWPMSQVFTLLRIWCLHPDEENAMRFARRIT